MYRVFIDEVGNHDLKSSADPNHQYLGLTGVIMRLEYERGDFRAALNAIKREIFGTENIVLHRREMLNGKPPFEVLQDDALRQRFDEMLLKLLSDATYRVFTVVIDKREHQRKYVVWRFHPYHYCLTGDSGMGNKMATLKRNRPSYRRPGDAKQNVLLRSSRIGGTLSQIGSRPKQYSDHRQEQVTSRGSDRGGEQTCYSVAEQRRERCSD